jgi:sterol desaturase/sphingolipid hydroxylase (fatty acid hydroxylase superfamily)
MFENHKTLEDVGAMDWPNVILWAAPVMFALVFIEWGISIYQKREVYHKKDFLAASTIGLVNVGISAALKVFIFGAALFVWNVVPWKIEVSWWSFILCFISLDLARYWAHRVAHEKRFWWATHVTHHSSELYNLSVSFRLGWTQHIKLIFFFPVMVIGFDPFVFFICHQVAVLYQFWIHTEYIQKLPKPIEYVFITPSHHRVHHGTDVKYLDKNYGSTFIIWDRIFGTFKEEEERPSYGITKPVNTYNPITLNFHEWIDIVADLKQAKNGTEVKQILFGRPDADVIAKRMKLEQHAAATKEKKTEPAISKIPEHAEQEAELTG